MREVVFNTEVVNSLKSAGVWAHKIGDAPIFSGMKTRFTPEKPCDIVACSESGRFIGIEGKQFKKWQGFYKSVLRDNQIEALDDFAHKRKGRAYVFLNIRIASPQENWCVIFDWKEYRDRILTDGFTIKEIKAKSVGIWVKGYKGQFDLRHWVRYAVERRPEPYKRQSIVT